MTPAGSSGTTGAGQFDPISPVQDGGFATTDLIATLRERNVLNDADAHVTDTVSRLTGEHRPEVLLAVALAVRAPRLGHVCLELRRVREVGLAPEGQARVDVELPELAPWLAALKESPAVRADGVEDHTAPLVLDGQRLYLDRYWRYEQRLISRLLELLDQQPEHIDPALLQRHLDKLFPDDEDALQRRATENAARRCLTVLTGGPGTGKTTTVVRMLATLWLSAPEDYAPRIVLCAPTGKAAARMAETVRGIAETLPVPEETVAALQGLPALTMHRLLGWRPNSPTRFAHDAGNPLPYDVVVVDEASMASLPMMTPLVDALGERTRLILVGDRDQLTSVDAGAVFSNICGPSEVTPYTPQPTLADAYDGVEGDVPGGAGSYGHPELAESIVTLTRFHRFGSGSGIGEVARAIQRIGTGGASAEEALHLMRAGRTRPGDPGRDEEVALVAPSATGRHPLPRDLLGTVVSRYGEAVRLALEGAPATEVLEAFERIRVLTALRRGPDGVHALNLAIERALASAVPGYAAGEAFPIGQPLLVTRNDHQSQLYNGDVGVVVRDPDSPARRRVAFPTTGGGVRLLAPARLPETEPVFAMSIHKSQGSQFGEVVLVLPRVDSPLLSRELIYTGVTRAEQSVTIVADEHILATALGRRVQRASGLAERLWGVS